MRTKPDMWDYLRSYRQDETMLWVWRIIMVMAVVNGCIDLLDSRWHNGMLQLVLAAFILRITTLERYISDCNEARERLRVELENKEKE